MANTHDLSVASYNCKHFKEVGLKFCLEILQNSQILFIQEHCLYEKQFTDFYKLGDVNYIAVSAMDEKVPLYGRPHGGCGIIWKNSLKCKVEPVSCDTSRICAAVFTLDDGTQLLLINTYLPCDDRYRSENYSLLIETLSMITCLINDNNHDAVILGGDFNCDFSRNTPHVCAVKEFITALDLEMGVMHPCATVDYTFECKASQSLSLIDHFFISRNIMSFILRYHTISSVDNLSDHDPLVCKMQLDVSYFQHVDTTFSPKAAWYKANTAMIEEYRNLVDRKLVEHDLNKELLKCSDVKCDKHNEAIARLFATIVQACLQAEDNCIPKTGPSKSKRIPGWNDHVGGLRKEALHWHHEWIRLGRPRDGTVRDNMLQSRKSYHYAIRFCRHNSNTIRSQKMAESMSCGSRDFWTEVRRLNSVHKPTPAVIDDANTPQDILKIFHEKFRGLYASVKSSEEDLTELMERIDKDLPSQVNADNPVFRYDIGKLIKKLKAGKADGYLGVSSDCFLNGSKRLQVWISLLFRVMTVHGYAPNDLLIGTMSPIPKGKAYTSASDKYRAITLINSLLKLYDYIILDNQAAALSTDSLQFGFKQNSSTTLCSSMVNEIVRLFKSRGSTVYAVMLDATKAFDRIEFSRLFEILIDRGMDILYVRTLLYMYRQQKLRLKWNGNYSETFEVHNGVKQGGVISPILFGIYLDQLLKNLRDSRYGCSVGPYYFGCLAYADDVVLLAPSKLGLIKMLKICQDYAQTYKLQFNGSKSQFIIFDKAVACGSVTLDICGTEVANVAVVTHLGHRIYSDLHLDDYDNVLASFYAQYNSFRSRFSGLASVVQSGLFSTYCTSFYGCLLLPHRKIKKLSVVWRKTIRAIWRLPWRTHCGIVANLMSPVCTKHALVSRFTKFAISVMQHSVPEIAFIFNTAIRSKHSTFAANLQWCTDELGARDYQVGDLLSMIRTNCSLQCKAGFQVLTHTLRELTMVRDGISSLNFNNEELSDLINDICLN